MHKVACKFLMLFKCFLILQVTLIILGCAPTGIMSKDFQFSQGSNIGVAAFSVECEDFSSYPHSSGYVKYFGKYYWFALNTTKIRFSCNEGKQIKLLNLQGGEYLLMQPFIGYEYPKDFPGIHFIVTPGKVSYVGNFVIDKDNNGFYTFIYDKQETDIPLIRSMLPNISGDRYIVNIMKFRDTRLIWLGNDDTL